MNNSHNEIDIQTQTKIQKECIDNNQKIENKIVSDKKEKSTNDNKVNRLSTDSTDVNSKALNEKFTDICFGVNYII
jgi:hypothetical protein